MTSVDNSRRMSCRYRIEPSKSARAAPVSVNLGNFLSNLHPHQQTAASIMKRRSQTQNLITTTSNEKIEYVVSDTREFYAMQTTPKLRKVDCTQLQKPITLPRWSRAAKAYGSGIHEAVGTPSVPQLAPEIRLVPVEECCYYEDGNVEEIEQLEVDGDGAVDVCAIEESSAATPIVIARPSALIDDRPLVDLASLYTEMEHMAPVMSVEELNDTFGTASNMSHPLDVKTLIEQAQKSGAEENARFIASMAMQINFMKREIARLREDLVDTRTVTLERHNMDIAGRTFDLNGPVLQHWYIPEEPPLLAVDLVKVARDVSLRAGRKNMKTRDAITRFVRACFDVLIPRDQIRNYTVRDRPSTRGQTKDIGGRAKDQITACILDLMKLYDSERLDAHARHDRCSFSDFVNQAMKTVMYDLRRVTPKSRKLLNASAVDDEQKIIEAAVDEMKD